MPYPTLLVIKTSSLGDIIHMLPAISDAQAHNPHLQIDWVVEEAFAEIPAWHPAVRRVLPVALRRWRKQLSQRVTWAQLQAFRQQVQQQPYDWIVDTQGLLKSALLARQARGQRWGYDWHSIREPLASLLYTHTATISRQQHAIRRNRQLMANSLGYTLNEETLDYGLTLADFPVPTRILPQHYIVALHGTSRPDKEWGEAQWQQLLAELAVQGIHTLLPWGNERERVRAERLAAANAWVQVLPRSSLGELAAILRQALALIGLDTGLMHLAAALNKPCLALYPVTQAGLTGLRANNPGGAPLITVAGEETQATLTIMQRFFNLLP